jgi:hypothetical protein
MLARHHGTISGMNRLHSNYCRRTATVRASCHLALPFCGKLMTAAVLLALLATTAARAQDSPQDSIWDAKILAQPFDQAEFRAIRIPEWVQETTGVGYTLSVQSPEQRRRAVEAGVTISELGFVDPFYVYYDSRLLKRRSPHRPPDFVDKEVAAYRRLGVRILAVYPPTLQSEVYAAHPDWRRVPTNTTEVPHVDLEKQPYGGMLCLLGPYGDFFIDVLAEIVEKYQVDAFSFDGLHYGSVCYCRHCRENFRHDTGGDLPDVDLNDPAFRRYQHWADRRMEDLVRRMQTRLKGINPDVALVTWTTNAGRFGHLREMPRSMPARMNLLFDAPDQEFWLDETNRGATIVPALANEYVWACTNHRVAFSEPYLMSHGNPYGKDSFPAHEVLRRVLLAITHGAGPSLAVIQPEPLQQAAYDALAEIRRRKPWLTHKRPEPWGALLLSDNTRVFYGRKSGKVEDRYLAHVFGAYRTVLEEHLPVTMICDWNLTAEDLAPYQMLVLPNAACLSDAQAQAVRDYARAGGGLVASLDTSLCNEFGDVRHDFALADLFGVHHAGPLRAGADADRDDLDVNFAKGLTDRYWEQRNNVFDLRIATDSPLDSPRLRALIGRDPVTFKGPAIFVRGAESAHVAASIVPRSAAKSDPSPALITRTFGRGRVAYLPAGIDHAYYSYAYPYERLLLANAIRWTARRQPPVTVEAPMCVHATLFRQESGGAPRLLIHLFNDVNTTAFHALPDNDVPLREETLPIHGIAIHLHGYHAVRAVQQPEDNELPLSREGETTRLVVPRLDVHSIVVIELAGEP